MPPWASVLADLVTADPDGLGVHTSRKRLGPDAIGG